MRTMEYRVDNLECYVISNGGSKYGHVKWPSIKVISFKGIEDGEVITDKGSITLQQALVDRANYSVMALDVGALYIDWHLVHRTSGEAYRFQTHVNKNMEIELEIKRNFNRTPDRYLLDTVVEPFPTIRDTGKKHFAYSSRVTEWPGMDGRGLFDQFFDWLQRLTARDNSSYRRTVVLKADFSDCFKKGAPWAVVTEMYR